MGAYSIPIILGMLGAAGLLGGVLHGLYRTYQEDRRIRRPLTKVYRLDLLDEEGEKELARPLQPEEKALLTRPD